MSIICYYITIRFLNSKYADNSGSTVTEYPESRSTFAYDSNGSLISDSGRGKSWNKKI